MLIKINRVHLNIVFTTASLSVPHVGAQVEASSGESDGLQL